jgi:hypothetical protein
MRARSAFLFPLRTSSGGLLDRDLAVDGARAVENIRRPPDHGALKGGEAGRTRRN